MTPKTYQDWIVSLRSLKQWSAIRSLNLGDDIESLIERLADYGASIEAASPSAKNDATKRKSLPKSKQRLKVERSSSCLSNGPLKKESTASKKKQRPDQTRPQTDKAEKERRKELLAFGVFIKRNKLAAACHVCKMEHVDGWLYENSKGKRHCYCSYCRNKYLPKTLSKRPKKRGQDAMLRRVSGSFGARQ